MYVEQDEFVLYIHTPTFSRARNTHTRTHTHTHTHTHIYTKYMYDTKVRDQIINTHTQNTTVYVKAHPKSNN